MRNLRDDEHLNLLSSSLKTSMLTSPTDVNPDSWIADSCCAVKEESYTWSRAKIMCLKPSSNNSRSIATVFFYDAGRIKEVSTENLRHLPEDFKKATPYATPVHLSDIKPTGGTFRWSASACEKLKEYVEVELLKL